jgi:60 kDa SS-A/Ro ribonucleoprotein
MSKFNKNTKTNVFRVVDNHPDVTANKAGGIAFKSSAKLKLALRTVTAMMGDDSFYQSGKSRDSDFRSDADEVMQDDPLFVLKDAIFNRKVMYNRSATTSLLGEFALSPCKVDVPNSRKYMAEAIQRPDDITELIAYVMQQNRQRKAYSGKLPMVVKNAVAEAFTKFDAYQLAKYNRDGEITLADALRLTHPVPKNEEQSVTFKKLREGTLEVPYTWEVQLSTKGNNAEVWHDIIWARAPDGRRKLPYMATLRNLRNMIKVGISSKDIDEVVRILTDPKGVANSKQFPFRFYSANREIFKARLWSPDPVDDSFEKISHKSTEADRTKLMDALDIALEMSVDNIPDYEGITFIACDNSGSMDMNPVSTGPEKRSKKYHKYDVDSPKITCKDVSTLFGAMIHKKCTNSIVSVFADRFATVPLSKRASIFDNMKKIGGTNVGGSTYAHLALDYLTDNNIMVNRIIMLTDEQCYSETDSIPKSSGRMFYTHDRCDNSVYASLLKYKRKVNPKVFMYVIDLKNYGTVQIPESEKNVCTMGGYSDKVLSFIPMFEKSREGLVDAIEKIHL